MMQNFILFSDLQKKVTTSPIKTWRLLMKLREEGKMGEGEDWQKLDRKLYVNVPRFIVELEHLGYGNLKSDDFKKDGVISDEIKKLSDELRLISSEITESRIQEEMKSDEITIDQSKPKVESESIPLKSNEISLISNDIIKGKDEIINILKENVNSKGKDIEHLRGVVDTLSKQNEILTRQNAWLTNLITAPKEPTSSVKSDDIRGTTEAHAVEKEEDQEDTIPNQPPSDN